MPLLPSLREDRVTLALACLTPEFVTLVADRRVVVGAHIDDDFATTVIVVCDRGAVACSGLARLPFHGLPVTDWPRMDEWIVRILGAQKVTTLSVAAKALCTAATQAFRGFPGTPAPRRHALILAVWSLSEGGRRSPVLCTVSNALDERWEWLTAAGESFRQRVFVQDDRKFSLCSIGAKVSQPTLGRQNVGPSNSQTPYSLKAERVMTCTCSRRPHG
jgi:hypothetical protein